MMANDHRSYPGPRGPLDIQDQMGDAALAEALDDLERLLRGSAPSTTSTTLDDIDDDEDGDIPLLSPVTQRRTGALRARAREEEEQDVEATYAEPPLLANAAAAASRLALNSTSRDEVDSEDDLKDLLSATSDDPQQLARLRRVVDRLVSEIDIIANDCVAQALRNVERDVQIQVRERVRKHLHIVLPELLDDMSN